VHDRYHTTHDVYVPRDLMVLSWGRRTEVPSQFRYLTYFDTILYSEDSSGCSLLALSTMDSYIQNNNGSQWIRQNRIICTWKFYPLRSLWKYFMFMSLSVTTLHYFAILLGNLHKASTL